MRAGGRSVAAVSPTARCHQPTSCHAPCLNPACAKTPMGENPIDSWNRTLPSFGRAMPAYAMWYPNRSRQPRSDVYRPRARRNIDGDLAGPIVRLPRSKPRRIRITQYRARLQNQPRKELTCLIDSRRDRMDGRGFELKRRRRLLRNGRINCPNCAGVLARCLSDQVAAHRRLPQP